MSKKEEKKQESGYLTAEGLNVTEYINKGKTKSFDDKQDAIDYAKNKRSYIYELYSFIVKGRQRIVSFHGWAVPN